jgi:hypothetical protein
LHGSDSIAVLLSSSLLAKKEIPASLFFSAVLEEPYPSTNIRAESPCTGNHTGLAEGPQRAVYRSRRRAISCNREEGQKTGARGGGEVWHSITFDELVRRRGKR